ETTEMIEESINKVNQGSAIAEKTAEALKEIVGGVGRVNELVSQIAVASNEQAQGITQVNTALGQLDQVTQQNTANAEQSAAASMELSNQAQGLEKLLTRFTLARKEPEVAAIPPEMMAAFQQFMQQQSRMANSLPSGYGGAPARPSNSIDPSQVISLDDDSFGRY
ncbi:MAG: methyl-accepting chemotaxis protein, partial [Pseudomonadales bacterium]|nr:methyl-accepting chemotaxis protein [Pseudomonadales bacterium]